MDTWIVAITGATGAVFGKRLLERLQEAGAAVFLTVSQPGQRVAGDELGWDFSGEPQQIEQRLRGYLNYNQDDDHLRYFDPADIGCCLASGSFRARGMIVVPCSMATAAGIAHGMSRNLIERAADVTIKEGRPLLLVPRETPLSAIHLGNLLALAQNGVRIAPPVPAFYPRPGSIDDLVDFFITRILNLLGISDQSAWHW
jgi:4-hydroxy-3-polyprenylbenzoate decarboxylase